jgi:hypothetical protein
MVAELQLQERNKKHQKPHLELVSPSSKLPANAATSDTKNKEKR